MSKYLIQFYVAIVNQIVRERDMANITVRKHLDLQKRVIFYSIFEIWKVKSENFFLSYVGNEFICWNSDIMTKKIKINSYPEKAWKK